MLLIIAENELCVFNGVQYTFEYQRVYSPVKHVKSNHLEESMNWINFLKSL